MAKCFLKKCARITRAVQAVATYVSQELAFVKSFISKMSLLPAAATSIDSSLFSHYYLTTAT